MKVATQPGELRCISVSDGRSDGVRDGRSDGVRDGRHTVASHEGQAQKDDHGWIQSTGNSSQS